MQNLNPSADVQSFEIASALFTDYAEKQRLVKIPKGKMMVAKGDGLPDFPEGTILVKTFYYHDPAPGITTKRPVETRLLIKNKASWNAATYKWNNEKTEALLITQGATLPLSFSDQNGSARTVNYKIPSQKDCGSCHRSDKELIPIGPKLKNLNVPVYHDGNALNQIAYFKKINLLKSPDPAAITKTASYTDQSLSVEKRARAYLDINCAHCHNPSGIAASQSLNLDLKTPFQKTGISLNKDNIDLRMSNMGDFHMPQKGTTILHKEGIALIRKYLESLDANPQSIEKDH